MNWKDILLVLRHPLAFIDWLAYRQVKWEAGKEVVRFRAYLPHYLFEQAQPYKYTDDASSLK